MYRPLLIDYNYQITNNASGQIARTFWETLSPEKYDVTIVSALSEDGMNSKWPVFPVDGNTWLQKCYRYIYAKGFKDFVYLPDLFFAKYRNRVNKLCDRFVPSNQYDYIHTISNPQIVQLIGLDLKRKTGHPWVAQFYDPWVENTVCDFKLNSSQKHYDKLELMIAQNADLIIHTNDLIVDSWIKRYGSIVEKKIIKLPLSFNMHLKQLTEDRHPNDRINIVHIGTIYGGRTIKDFVDALKEIKESGINIEKRVVFKFIGGVDEKEIKYVEDNGLNDLFVFYGALHPSQLEQYYQEADYFLALDVKSNKSYFYPSKLMMYYYYKKPIIGVTTKGSVMDYDLKESQNISIYYDNKEETKNMLLKILRSPIIGANNNKEYWKRFSVESVIEEYENALIKFIIK